MKYLLAGIIIVAAVIAGFWTYAKIKKGKPATSPTPVVVVSNTPTTTPIYTVAPLPSIGNQPGNTAPDFKLQNTSLRQFRGRSGVIIWLHPYNVCQSNEKDLNGLRTKYSGYTVLVVHRGAGANACPPLFDEADAIHRLYGTNEQSYFIIVGIDGVIRETASSPLR